MPKHAAPPLPSISDIPDLDGKTPAELLKDAKEYLEPKNRYAHSRIEWWFAYLGITPLQEKVLGRIWSFQYANDDDGRDRKNFYTMSHASAARSMGENPDNWAKAIRALVKKGIIVGTKNGPRKPVTYQVDLIVCSRLVAEKMASLQENRESIHKKGRERQEKWAAKNINSTNKEIRARAEQQLRRDMRPEEKEE